MNHLKKLLNMATKEDLEALAQILTADKITAASITEAFSYQSQSVFGYAFCRTPGYKEIVWQVLQQMKIPYKAYETTQELEIKLAQKVMETVWEKMTPEQRQEMEEQLKKTAQQYDKGSDLAKNASIFAALGAAQLSGFSVYLLASTALGFLTHAVSITLPFVVYSTMSSAIAIIIGPVGWIGAGIYALWALTGPNYKKLIPAILFVLALRQRIEGNYI